MLNLFKSHWLEKSFLSQAFPASFRLYHCTLWRISLSFSKFNIDLITDTRIALSAESFYKSDA